MDHINRKWVKCPIQSVGKSSTQNAFGVISYNILADCHVTPGDFPYCPAGSRFMKDRHEQLMIELEFDLESVDIICLQEVGETYFVQQLQPALLKLGFSGSFFKKQHGTAEGEATFYRNRRFSLTEERHVSCTQLIKETLLREKVNPEDVEQLLTYADKDNVIIMSKLYDSVTKKTLYVGNIHSTFSDYKFVDITTLQVVAAFNGLVEFAGDVDKPLIFCGDFNQEPHLPGYKVMHDGDLSEESIQYLMKFPIRTDNSAKRKPKYLIEEARDCFKHRCRLLKSAYKEVMGSEPPFTNYEDMYGTMLPDSKGDQPIEEIQKNSAGVYESDPEKYGTQLFRATLDYLWFNSGQLDCFRALDIVDESVVKKFHACPNQIFPSDHIMLKASYCFI